MQRILVIDLMGCFYTLFHSKERDKVATFLSEIYKLKSLIKADRIIYCYERGKSRYRTSIYPEYKLKREETRAKQSTEEIARHTTFREKEVPYLVSTLEMLGQQIICVPNVEGDDVMASLVKEASPDLYQLVVLTSDADIHQLIRKGVVVGAYNKDLRWHIKEGRIPSSHWLNESSFIQEMGITPIQWADVKALGGCTSDAVDSPAGVGEGTAIKLIKKYGNLAGVKANIEALEVERLTKKAKESLQTQWEMVERNVLITNLLYDEVIEQEVIGITGAKYIRKALHTFENIKDMRAFNERCFENGWLDFTDQEFLEITIDK